MIARQTGGSIMAIAPEEEYHSNKQYQQLILLSHDELAALRSSPPKSCTDGKVRKVRRPKDTLRQDQLPFASEK